MGDVRYGQFYIVQFRRPEWIGPEDPQHTPVAEMAATLAEERSERTFDHESQLASGSGPATACGHGRDFRGPSSAFGG